MTDRELEIAVSDYCSIVGEWNRDEIGGKLIPYCNYLDFSKKAVGLLDRCYSEYVDNCGGIPTYSELSQYIFDDYSNRQYAAASLEIATYHDCTAMTRSEFDKCVEELAFSNIDSDSYGGYLNYDELISNTYEMHEENHVLLLTEENDYSIDDFLGYTRFMKNKDSVVDKVDWLYENEDITDIVVGDSQQILIPDFVLDNTFRNSYGELCIITDNKLEKLRSA